MSGALDPFPFVLIAVAGWTNQRPLQVIDYLHEENRFCESNSAGACGSTTTSAVDWPPLPKVWDGSFWRKWPPL